MLTFASDVHRRHHPRQPFHDQGHMIDPPEVPARAERIREAIAAAAIGPIRAPDHHGLEPILRVHSTEYVEFLEHIHDRWRTATNADEHSEAVPYARPIRGQLFDTPRHPIAQLGWYSHDNDAILAGTWAAAIGAADAGDEDAAFTVDSAEGHELAWYAVQELHDFPELLPGMGDLVVWPVSSSGVEIMLPGRGAGPCRGRRSGVAGR